MDSNTKTGTSWNWLWTELCHRAKAPAKHFTFVAYVVIGIVICGGTSVWVELVKYLGGLGATANLESIRTAINTYFPAIGCAAAIQLVLAAETRKYLSAFGLMAACFFSVSSALLLLLQRSPVTRISWILPTVGCFFAIAMWWISNATERVFLDTAPPSDAALGGPLNTDLSGDTANFVL